MLDCLFCDFVSGKKKCYKIWEDEHHIAFLTPFPNTPGVTVVITKDHYDSYAFDLPDDVLMALTLAAKKVGKIIDKTIPGVGRTGMVFEGFGINHIHAKLFPMHGTAQLEKWQPIESSVNTFFKEYPGYITTHDCHGEMDETAISELADKLKAAAK